MTRCTDLNKVKFYVKPEDDDVDELTDDKMIRYIEKKTCSYKIQDRKANRETDEKKHIHVQWLYQRTGARCNRCSCEFEFDIQNGIVFSNLTAQRLDNFQSHHRENCIIYCKKCNCREKCYYDENGPKKNYLKTK